MNASIVVIGDEILLGHVTDINTPFLARRFDQAGIRLSSVRVVGDDGAAIATAVNAALDDAELVITTGGLGPTKDDITKRVMASIFGGGMVEHPEMLAHIEAVMASRGREMNDLTRTQAILPESCVPLLNRVGTAPGMLFTRPDGKRLVALPGVPFEMRSLFDNEVAPIVGADAGAEHRFIWVDGLAESAVARMLDHLSIHIAYLPQGGYLILRLDGDEEIAKADEICQILDGHVLATSGENVSLARLLIDRLAGMELTLALAESCTGGNIAHSITLEPGASEVLRGGVVAYSNDVKVGVLGVDNATLAAYGAVSGPVAAQMAQGAARVMDADFAVATSGIAGPGGAVAGKPVGTVCFGLHAYGETQTFTMHFPGDRDRVITAATNRALIMLLSRLG